MENDRGIFILTALKKILDKLIYIEKYEDVDKHMSDSNIGARKGRNVKNHLFIIYGIINSVIKGKEACIDIQIYDLVKAFDALWLEDCMLDLFDTLSKENRDEKVALLYESNRKKSGFSKYSSWPHRENQHAKNSPAGRDMGALLVL